MLSGILINSERIVAFRLLGELFLLTCFPPYWDPSSGCFGGLWLVGWFFSPFWLFFPVSSIPPSLLPSFPFPLGSVFPFELFSSGFILTSACISQSFRLPVYNPVFVPLSFLSKELVCLAISSYVSPLHHLVSSFFLFVKLLVPVFT